MAHWKVDYKCNNFLKFEHILHNVFKMDTNSKVKSLFSKLVIQPKLKRLFSIM